MVPGYVRCVFKYRCNPSPRCVFSPFWNIPSSDNRHMKLCRVPCAVHVRLCKRLLYPLFSVFLARGTSAQQCARVHPTGSCNRGESIQKQRDTVHATSVVSMLVVSRGRLLFLQLGHRFILVSFRWTRREYTRNWSALFIILRHDVAQRFAHGLIVLWHQKWDSFRSRSKSQVLRRKIYKFMDIHANSYFIITKTTKKQKEMESKLRFLSLTKYTNR